MITEINFITSNQRKIISLKSALLAHGLDIGVISSNLDLMEPQFDTVKEVSAFKAKEAYEVLKCPVLVEDGGFVVEVLNDFPGVYTKFALKTIGARGILKLLNDETNRRAHFISTSSYIDENGRLWQFERSQRAEVEIADRYVDIDSPYAWSELWKIIYLPRYKKMMCELSKAEVDDFYSTIRGSLQHFADWYALNYNNTIYQKD